MSLSSSVQCSGCVWLMAMYGYLESQIRRACARMEHRQSRRIIRTYVRAGSSRSAVRGEGGGGGGGGGGREHRVRTRVDYGGGACALDYIGRPRFLRHDDDGATCGARAKGASEVATSTFA